VTVKFSKDFGIRAWFGTLVIGSFSGLFWYATVYQPEALPTIKDAFVPIVMAIVAFYFGQKSTNNGGDQK
jgi:hypothetical protein